MFGSPLITDITFFLIGFVLLTVAAELLVRGASRLAAKMNISAVVIGLTVVAFGTSLPEFLVTIIANLEGGGRAEIAIGNIVGSNIANLALILGVAGIMAAISIEGHLIRREYPILIAVTGLFVWMAWDGSIGRLEGLGLLIALIVFTIYSYNTTRLDPMDHSDDVLDVVGSIDAGIAQPSTNPLRDTVYIVIGLGGLMIGAEWLLSGAESIARAIGVSDLIIGLTLVAIGTSLPELATTIIAVRRGEGDIAVGNVVGSNFFNMTFVGGLNALIKPLPIPFHMRTADFPMMIATTLLVYLLALRRPHCISRWQGALLLIIYLVYCGWLFIVNGG